MLSYLTIQGTPFDVGAALGRFGAQAVHEVLRPGAAWAEVMRWRDSPALTRMAEHTRTLQPACWQELQGLASGLGLAWDEVFAWNCRGDVWAMAPDGCTTVQLPGEVPRFAHNEDGDPGLVGRCALAEIHVHGGTHFAAVVYPGSLPGHTIAVTGHGLAVTVNNLRTLHANDGLPRMVLARALLDQPSIEAGIRLLQEAPRAGGFHFTLGQAGFAQLYSIEFNAAQCSVRRLEQPSLHANHMIHPAMAHQPQIVTGSSGHRQLRGEALLAEAAARAVAPDPLAILFDQSDARFPIFRNDLTDSDRENTLATAVIRIGSDAVDWQIHTGRSVRPLYQLRNGALS